MAQTIALTTQEREFAMACIDFVYEADRRLPRIYALDEDRLEIPADLRMRKAFIEIGLKRLKKVLARAVSSAAIEDYRRADLESNLKSFDLKMAGFMASARVF